MTDPSYDADVAIVGAGPAGLAAALAARRAGMERVRVFDRGSAPRDKACGEGLMPDGVASLRRLGVDTDRLAAAPFRGIRYVDSTTARQTVAEARFPGRAGLGVRRPSLHRALCEAAIDAGAELSWGRRVTALEGSRLTVDGQELRARFVVGADGLLSRVRRWAGLESAQPPSGGERFGIRAHFQRAPWSDLVEVHWRDGAEAYVTPVAADEVGVAVLFSRDSQAGGRARDGFGALIDLFPTLSPSLTGFATASRPRGAGPLRQRVRGVVRGRVALIGDAGGYVDAITGEGLSLAFHQAEALGAALARGDLRPYRRAHARLRRLPDAMTHLLLAVERRPWLRRRTLRALAAEPDLFRLLLGVHSRNLPLRRFGVGGALRLAWRLAAA